MTAGIDGGTGFIGQGTDKDGFAETDLPEGVKRVFMALDSDEEEKRRPRKSIRT